MSKQKLREEENTLDVSSIVNEVDESFKRSKIINSLKNRRQEASENLDRLVKEYIEAQEKYGDEHHVTIAKYNALRVCSMMFEVLEVVTSVQSAFTDFAILNEMMDDSMSLIDMSLNSRVKYSLFYRIKQNIKIRKYMRNIQNRFDTIYRRLADMQNMSSYMNKIMNKYSLVNTAERKGKLKKNETALQKIDDSLFSKDIQERIYREKVGRGHEVELKDLNQDKYDDYKPSGDIGSPDVSDIV